jgi:parallel beta-helix repeat protein
MKKNAWIVLVSLSLFCVFALNGGMLPIRLQASASRDPQIIRVPLNFTSIQAAVNYATSGDTVIVAPGTYQENLVLNKSIALVGEDRNTTIIDGSNDQVVISIISDNVTVQDLTVTKSVHGPNDVGIGIENAVGASITNVIITDTTIGLGLRFCTYGFLSNNIITNSTVIGITCYFSGRNFFSKNAIYGNSIGILIYTSSSNVFVANTLSNNEQGMSLAAGSRQNIFFHNNFEDLVSTDQSPNIWSQNGEGNFWISYTGTDTDNDGIGNSTYPIDANNFDDYPLMGIFSEFTVTTNATYFVDIVSNSTISNFGYEIGRETGNKMITFNANGQTGQTGFCRMTIPTSIIDYPLNIITNEGQAQGQLLIASNQTDAYLYFTYSAENQTITVFSSNTVQAYNSLLDKYNKLQADFDSLNATCQNLLISQNSTLQALLDNYAILLQNFTQLQNSYLNLNSSLQNNLSSQAETTQNLRNLTYVFAALTAAFLITASYLSTRGQMPKKTKAQIIEEHD